MSDFFSAELTVEMNAEPAMVESVEGPVGTRTFQSDMSGGAQQGVLAIRGGGSQLYDCRNQAAGGGG